MGRVWTEFGTKMFFLFFGLSHPVLAIKKGWKEVFWFFDFFFYFFRNFLARVEYERNSGLKCFLSFSAYLIPFWQKIMLERGFFICFILSIFFLEFSCLGRVWTEFGTNFFFFSFSAYLISSSLKIMPEKGFLIFWKFLLF